MGEHHRDMRPLARSPNERWLGQNLFPASRAARRVALFHLFSIGGMLLIGIFIAGVGRVAIAMGGHKIAEIGFYNRVMTLHAIVMVFLVLIPGIPFALGRLLLEQRNSDRLGWISFCTYWTGASVVVVSTLSGKLNTGLCYVISYSAGHQGADLGITLGVFMVGVACAMNGYGVVVAARRPRDGTKLTNGRSILVILICMSTVAQALVLPVQGWTLAQMFAERFRIVRVTHVAGGDETLLLRHLFWFYVQPAMLAAILPVVGVITRGLEHSAAPAIRHLNWIIHSALAFTILSFVTWGIHLVSAGQSLLMSALFSAASLMLLIPMSLPFPIWLAHLRRPFPQNRTRMIYITGAMLMLALGILSGVPMALLGVRPVLDGTYFELGNWHFIGAAVAVTAFFGVADSANSESAPGESESLRVWIVPGMVLFGLLSNFSIQLILGSRLVLPPAYGEGGKFPALIRLGDLGLALVFLGLLIKMFDWARQLRTRHRPSDFNKGNAIVENASVENT